MTKLAVWDPVLIAVVALAGALCLGGLGGRDLWQDEAETALLGRSVLARGLPYASDGVNVISAEAGKEFGPDFLWRWSPWIQFYMAAVGLAMGGATAAAARWPFALTGLACVPLLYALARRSTGSLLTARLSALFMALSVPFLLHARQARWHAPSYLFALAVLWFLSGLRLGARFSAAGLALSGALLFYTNYFTGGAFLAAVLFSALFVYKDAPWRRGLLVSAAACATLCGPGLIFYQVLDKPAGFDPMVMLGHLVYYSGAFCTFLLPFPLIILLVVMRRESIHREGPAREPSRELRFFLILSLLYIGALCLGPWRMFRYLTLLLPVAALLAAGAVAWIYEKNKLWGGIAIVVFLFSNAFHMIPLELIRAPGTLAGDAFPSAGPLRFPFFGYLYELSFPFSHCDRLMTEHLRAHAAPSDTVLATYGDLPLQFYTGLKVEGGFQGQSLPLEPEWIIVHPYVVSRQPGKDYDVLRFIREKIDMRAYRAVELPCRDFMLGHCPEPALHAFTEPLNRPAATLLRRVFSPSPRIGPGERPRRG